MRDRRRLRRVGAARGQGRHGPEPAPARTGPDRAADFRKKYPNAERPYKAWGYPIVPVLFLLVAGWLLINTMMTSPERSFIGIGLIILGLPVYYYLVNRGGSLPDESK